MEQNVARVAEISEGKGKVVEVGKRKILIMNVEGEISALDSFCAYRGAPLVEGPVIEGTLLCPWHGATFDVTTGTCSNAPEESVRVYPVTVRNGQIWIDLPK